MPSPSASLVPPLMDAVNKRILYPAITLCPGDKLHLLAPALGFSKGRTLDVYGYCLDADEQGRAYAVRAYVRPDKVTEFVVAFSERDATRYPADNQREVWFGHRLLWLVEVDLTDYGHALRLERATYTATTALPAPPIGFQQVARPVEPYPYCLAA